MTERFVIYLHMDKPPLTANKRWGHHMAEARVVAETRRTAAWVARAARIGRAAKITAQIVWRPKRKAIRDPSNIWPTQKAVIDGLRDARVVPDDDPRYVEEKVPRILEPGKQAGVWLVVEVLERT